MVAFIIVWALAGGAYVLFAGAFSLAELATAAICGLIVSLWSAAIRRQAVPRLAYEPGALAAGARAVAGLLPATLRVGLRLATALVAQVGGRRVVETFAHGSRTEPRDAGRRAVATLAVSLAPDRFVLRLPEGRDRMVLHELASAPGEVDPRWGS